MEAEEIFQEICLDVLRRSARLHFANLPEFVVWVRITAENKIKNFRRLKQRREHNFQGYILASGLDPAHPGEPESTARPAAQALEERERTAILDEALAGLQPTEALLLKLYFYEDLSMSEIARCLDISVQAAWKKFFHALEKLRLYLRRVHPEMDLCT